MTKFLATLASQDTEHKRFVTLSRVPCSKCHGGPRHSTCKTCAGRGDEPATRDSAAAHLEAMEKEYAAFRLDERATVDRYPALTDDSLEQVMQATRFFPDDEVLIDGRFVRGGKVLSSGAPFYSSPMRGWRAFHEQERPYKVLRVGSADLVAAVTAGQYGVPKKNQYDGTAVIDFDTDTIKTALTTNSYTVDIDTHDFFNDVTNELATAGNYTAGGWTLASKTVSYDTATDQSRLDAADISQASATFTARRAVTYKSTGTSSTSPLLSFLDFGADVSPSAGTFAITWDATGIVVDDVT